MLAQSTESLPITQSVVVESERLQILPKYLGRYMLAFESEVYTQMSRLCESYEGGYWEYYELSNHGFFMATGETGEKVSLCNTGNWFQGSMSAEAAGIVVCLFALNSLLYRFEDQRDIERLYHLYDALRAFAGEHDESRLIYRAID